MITSRTVIFVLLVALIGCSPGPQASSLFSASSRAQGSKNVDVIISEVERREKTSLVDVQFNYGPSVASSVFIACSFAELAKLRGYRYSVQIEDFGKKGRYLVGFIASPSKDAIADLDPEFAGKDVSEIFDNETFRAICPNRLSN